MLNQLTQINWPSILAATVANSMFGAAWFMGIVGKRYAIALGRNDLVDQKPSALAIVGPMACGAVVAVTDAILLRSLGITTYGAALFFGALTGVGYLAAQTVNIGINPNFPRPFYYSALNAPYFLLGNLVSCAIITAMS